MLHIHKKGHEQSVTTLSVALGKETIYALRGSIRQVIPSVKRKVSSFLLTLGHMTHSAVVLEELLLAFLHQITMFMLHSRIPLLVLMVPVTEVG